MSDDRKPIPNNGRHIIYAAFGGVALFLCLRFVETAITPTSVMSQIRDRTGKDVTHITGIHARVLKGSWRFDGTVWYVVYASADGVRYQYWPENEIADELKGRFPINSAK